MIAGYLLPAAGFSAPRPMIQIEVTLEQPPVVTRLPARRGFVRGQLAFLIDTGSDATIISPDAARALGLDLTDADLRLLGARTFLGVGDSEISYIPLVGGLTFEDDETGEFELPVRMWVAEPGARQEWSAGLPSVLGRDTLRFFEFTLNYTTDPAVRLALLS